MTRQVEPTSFTNMNLAPSTVGGSPPLEACPPRYRPLIASIVVMTLCWSCSGGATDIPEDTVGREAFIGAYVDLRAAALSSGTTEIEGEVRDSILAVYGVTGEELLVFIDTHGESVEFMSELWSEIEGRLTERLEQNRQDADSEEL